MEPMTRMTMDFQGRYLDSSGRLVEPRCNDYYGRNSNYDRYGMRSMYNTGFYDNDKFQKYGRFMHFPERHMDMSGYQMDMRGRYMDKYGRHCNPYSRRHMNYPSNNYDNYHMYNPEKLMDMSNFQMDMHGRWMDSNGRYSSPFNNYGSRYHQSYPHFNYSWGQRSFNHPDRFFDMSNYQMDLDGKWMDTYGRHCHPFYDNSNYYGKQDNYNMYPHYNYNWGQKYYHYPEKYFDMSNYQMDFDGRWMDMFGRNHSPFNGYINNQGRQYHGQPHNSFSYGQRYQDRNFDIGNYQMDFDGRWMDMYGRYSHPFYGYNNFQGRYQHNTPHNFNWGQRSFYYPERLFDMGNYQMDFDGHWMDMDDRHCQPFSGNSNHSNRYQQNYYHSPSHNFNWGQRHQDYPERFFDMSGYQMDFDGRWMDSNNYNSE